MRSVYFYLESCMLHSLYSDTYSHLAQLINHLYLQEVNKTALKEKTALNHALKKNSELQTELDNMKEAYAEKKHNNKELKKKKKELEHKLTELNQYILKLKKVCAIICYSVVIEELEIIIHNI